MQQAAEDKKSTVLTYENAHENPPENAEKIIKPLINYSYGRKRRLEKNL